MKWPLSKVDTFLYGGGAIAATGAYLGLKHGPEDADTEDRVKAGIAYTGMAATAAAAVGTGIYAIGPKRVANGAWNLGKKYVNSQSAAYAKEAAKVGRFKALPVLASAPTMMTAGAAIGAMVAGKDHRTKGAVIGAGAGAAATVAVQGARMWGKMGRFGHGAALLSLSAAAFGVGESMSHQPEAAMIPNDVTGEGDYAAPEQAAAYNSGVKRRMKNMNATGDMIFGMHNSRHG
jgi:hypothetical protein